MYNRLLLLNFYIDTHECNLTLLSSFIIIIKSIWKDGQGIVQFSSIQFKVYFVIIIIMIMNERVYNINEQQQKKTQ